MSRNNSLLKVENLIANAWVSASSGDVLTVTNPAIGETIGTVPSMSRDEASATIDVAVAAQHGWQRRSFYERAAVLREWHRLIVDHKEELAHLMTLEAGKPLAESRAEIDYAASFVDWYAEEAKRAYGETIPSPFDTRHMQTMKQAIGVSAMITPWNFPSSMITRKAAPALAAGCTVVLKPDHRTPYSALALAELAVQAGFPSGVFNVITGDAAQIGQVFTSHAAVRKVSFTGSTQVGKILMAQAAPGMKKLSLELGGNAPFIVCEDADIGMAVEQAMIGKFRNAGQSCVSPSRFFVHRKHYESFVAEVTARTKELRVGNGMDEKNQIGTLIDANAIQKVDRLVREAVEGGATVMTGGHVHDAGALFYAPTVLRDVADDAAIRLEEIFGPVMAVSVFDEDDHAITQANRVDVGLASYVFTQNVARAHRYMREIETGMMGVNTGMISFAGAPFGGVKQSGIGREGGSEGLDAYLETKYIAIQT